MSQEPFLGQKHFNVKTEQLLEVVPSLYDLNDSPKRLFLRMTSVWKKIAMEETGMEAVGGGRVCLPLFTTLARTS